MVLGSLIPIDEPLNSEILYLQCRNIRITVNKQHAIMSFELFDVGYPVEQHNTNIRIPIKLQFDDYETTDKFLPDIDLDKIKYNKVDLMPSVKWIEDTRQAQVSQTTVPSITFGEINYLTGIPTKD